MRIKVCGMREPNNICAVAALPIHWMGFIFYPPSPRFVGAVSEEEIAAIRQLRVKRVGVFVNASPDQMMETAQTFGLDYLQLHGHESPDDCHTLQKRGYSLIKAISVATAADLSLADAYHGRVDYLLFDTKCPGYGGSGKGFDWRILQAYTGSTPFLLSGGIGMDSLAALGTFHHPQWEGVDLNSGFETAPGLKDTDLLAPFIAQLSKQPFIPTTRQ